MAPMTIILTAFLNIVNVFDNKESLYKKLWYLVLIVTDDSIVLVLGLKLNNFNYQERNEFVTIVEFIIY